MFSMTWLSYNMKFKNAAISLLQEIKTLDVFQENVRLKKNFCEVSAVSYRLFHNFINGA